jgi:ABC-type amino acid transport system permease subunit
MQVKCIQKSVVYNKDGKIEAGRSIDAGDICTIKKIILPNLLIQITYPISNGKRTAYVKNLSYFTTL